MTTKQSPDFNQLHSMRLLRYARNDCMRDFLRVYQKLENEISEMKKYNYPTIYKLALTMQKSCTRSWEQVIIHQSSPHTEVICHAGKKHER